jgi:hypothetical protein
MVFEHFLRTGRRPVFFYRMRPPAGTICFHEHLCASEPLWYNGRDIKAPERAWKEGTEHDAETGDRTLGERQDPVRTG